MKLKPGLGAFYATDQEMDQANSTAGADRALWFPFWIIFQFQFYIYFQVSVSFVFSYYSVSVSVSSSV